jgi:hypothetical protein
MKSSSLLLIVLCVFSATTAMAQQPSSWPGGCQIKNSSQDMGYEWSRYVGPTYIYGGTIQEFGFCRQTGGTGLNGAKLTCLKWIANRPVHCDEQTYSINDGGYAGTQLWFDANSDGRVDFCREVGDDHHGSCLLGPNFQTELRTNFKPD